MRRLLAGIVLTAAAAVGLGAPAPKFQVVNVKFAVPSLTARQIVKTALGAKELHFNSDIGWSTLRLPAGMSVNWAEFAALRLPGVAEAEAPVKRHALYTPDDTDYPQQYAPSLMGLNTAWNYTLGSPSITVAVVDTGIQLDHPDLKSHLEVLAGSNFVSPGSQPSDDNGHGTHCAGIIGAITNNNLGVAGVCQCTLMPVKVLDEDGNGYDSDISNGITFAADNGANIINLSLGGDSQSSMEQDAINYAISKGAIVTAAAGNDGVSEKYYPAADGGVISVAASTAANRLASYSNHGPWVSVIAPGDRILSTYTGSSYEVLSGTSMAAAEVSGVLAEIESYAPSGTPSGVIVNALLQGAVTIGTDTACGLVNAYNSMMIIKNGSQSGLTIQPSAAVMNLGSYTYGDASDMDTVDQSPFDVESAEMPNDDQQAAALADFFITQPSSKVKSLSATVCAYGYQGGYVRVSAYDFFHRRFVQIGKWAMSASTVLTQTAAFPSNLARFIHNGEVLIEVRGILPASSFIGLPPSFLFQVDQAVLKVSQ